MKFLKVFTFLSAIPILGICIFYWIVGDFNKQLVEIGVEYEILTVCIPEVIKQLPEITDICSTVDHLAWMFLASILALGIAFILLIAYKLTSIICGKSRRKISTLFPPLVFLNLLFLSGLVFIEGAILT